MKILLLHIILSLPLFSLGQSKTTIDKKDFDQYLREQYDMRLKRKVQWENAVTKIYVRKIQHADSAKTIQVQMIYNSSNMYSVNETSFTGITMSEADRLITGMVNGHTQKPSLQWAATKLDSMLRFQTRDNGKPYKPVTNPDLYTKPFYTIYMIDEKGMQRNYYSASEYYHTHISIINKLEELFQTTFTNKNY